MHMRHLLGAGLAGLGLCFAAPVMVATALVSAVEGQPPVPQPPARGSALGRIPAPMLRLYVQAVTSCPGLPWTVLAAIGTIETDNGQANLPGVHSGRNFAGAEGPMQFEPATFARFALPVPPGGMHPASPYDPTDAVYAAARMLCADGATRARGGLRRAVLAYNHSTVYVDQVLQLAQTLSVQAGSSAATPGETAVTYALSQLGTPYRWGGEAAGVGFDCSGLAQAAWGAARIKIPRVAQQQYDTGPVLPPAQPLAPGDLVFFGGPTGGVAHVGLFVGVQQGQAIMVDAPHSGAAVRLEPFPTTVGARWGADVFVGATDPAA